LKKRIENIKFQQDIKKGILNAKKTTARNFRNAFEFGGTLTELAETADRVLPFLEGNVENVFDKTGQVLNFVGNTAKNSLPHLGQLSAKSKFQNQRNLKMAVRRNMMLVQRKANFRQRKSVIPYSIFKPSDDHYINDDGSIISVRSNTGKERFFVQNYVSLTGYLLVAELEKNKDGLVLFPSTGTGFDRYGTVDAGGISTSPAETVGQGDHYLLPETAAALFGVINTVNSDFGMVVSLGDMSSSNGSDPWEQGFKHHAGHGHLGKRSGMDVDFRYLNKSGKSFQSKNAFGNSSFSTVNNQRLYDAAKTYGFTKNYQGHNGSLSGPTKVNGHNDHGHLGLDYKSLKWKYSKVPPTYRKFHWFNAIDF